MNRNETIKFGEAIARHQAFAGASELDEDEAPTGTPAEHSSTDVVRAIESSAFVQSISDDELEWFETRLYRAAHHILEQAQIEGGLSEDADLVPLIPQYAAEMATALANRFRKQAS